MANSKIDITAGSGIEVDTETESTDGQHRQVVVLGDPSTKAGVAPVDGTAGVKVNLGADNDVTVTSGTITAELSATDNAVLDNIQTSVDTVAAAVSTEMQVDIAGITPDLALGTDISDVFGTSSLVLATQQDDLGNTQDGLVTTSLGYLFDGSTWDRAPGSSADGALVNLGTNNDVTVTGTVDLGATDNAVLDAIAADTATLAAAVSTEMQVDIVGITPDLALGTDISNVFGTGDITLSAGADNVSNTNATLEVSNYGYVFDGTAWDRMKGDSTDGVLVNLGTNNDVTVSSGTITVGASENVIGAVVGQTVVHEFVPTCDTGGTDANDVLADTEVVSACFRANDKPGVLQTLTIVDKDDVGGALRIFLMSATGSLGTEDSGITITDANADNIMAVIDVETTDWYDLIGSRIACIKNLSIPIVPASGTDDMYCAVQAVTGGTYTASGLNIRFGILQD